MYVNIIPSHIPFSRQRCDGKARYSNRDIRCSVYHQQTIKTVANFLQIECDAGGRCSYHHVYASDTTLRASRDGEQAEGLTIEQNENIQEWDDTNGHNILQSPSWMLLSDYNFIEPSHEAPLQIFMAVVPLSD
jgi:hypothetical protein